MTTHTPEEIARVVCEQDPERPSTVDRARRHGDARRRHRPRRSRRRRSARRGTGRPSVLRQRLPGALDDIVLKALRKEPESALSVRRGARPTTCGGYLAEQPVDGRHGRAPLSRGRGWCAGTAWRWRRGAAGRRGRRARRSLARAIQRRAPSARGRPAAAARIGGAARPSVAVIDVPQPVGAARRRVALDGDGRDADDRAGRRRSAARRARPSRWRARRDSATAGGATGPMPSSALRRPWRRFRGPRHVRGRPTDRGARAVRIDVRVQRARAMPIAVVGTHGERGAAVRAGRRRRPASCAAHSGSTRAPADVTTAASAPRCRRRSRRRDSMPRASARLRVLDAVPQRANCSRQAAAREPGEPDDSDARWPRRGPRSATTPRAAAAAQRAFDAVRRARPRGAPERRRPAATRRSASGRTRWTCTARCGDSSPTTSSTACAWRPRRPTPAGAKEALATSRRCAGCRRRRTRIRASICRTPRRRRTLGDFAGELAAVQRARRLRRTVRRTRAPGAGALARRPKLLSRANRRRPNESLATARLFEEVGDRAGAALGAEQPGRGASAISRTSRQAIRMNEASLATSEEIGDRRACRRR